MANIIKLLENLLFPAVCEGCGEVGTYLCPKCAARKLDIRKRQECHVCKEQVKGHRSKVKSCLVHEGCKGKTSLDGVFVIAEYSKFVEDYVGDIKYEFYFAMIGDLVWIMNETLEKNELFKKIFRESVITFVPLNPWRKRWRGFNQADEIAKGVAKHFNINHLKLVKRVRKTKSQVGLSRKQRLANLKGAFEAQKHSLEYKSVIIVDDVMTSGGTLEECAQVLKQAGVGEVYGLVFARG